MCVDILGFLFPYLGSHCLQIMYDPTSLASPTLWNLWTRPLTDCHIKTDTVTPDGKPTEYNSASVCKYRH